MTPLTPVLTRLLPLGCVTGFTFSRLKVVLGLQELWTKSSPETGKSCEPTPLPLLDFLLFTKLPLNRLKMGLLDD